MNDTLNTETPEQTEARIRSTGAQKALTLAPSVIGHVRGLILERSSGEAGIDVKVERTPLPTQKVDDADEAFAQLVDWVAYWAGEFKEPLPSTSRVWRAREDHIGFVAGTTEEGAGMLVRLQSLWLLARHDRIAAHDSAAVYFDDVRSIVFSLRAKYPTSPRPPRLVHPRPCPTCGEAAVHAEWRSGDLLDVEIKCEVCQATIEPTRVEIARWLS